MRSSKSSHECKTQRISSIRGEDGTNGQRSIAIGWSLQLGNGVQLFQLESKMCRCYQGPITSIGVESDHSINRSTQIRSETLRKFVTTLLLEHRKACKVGLKLPIDIGASPCEESRKFRSPSEYLQFQIHTQTHTHTSNGTHGLLHEIGIFPICSKVSNASKNQRIPDPKKSWLSRHHSGSFLVWRKTCVLYWTIRSTDTNGVSRDQCSCRVLSSKLASRIALIISGMNPSFFNDTNCR